MQPSIPRDRIDALGCRGTILVDVLGFVGAHSLAPLGNRFAVARPGLVRVAGVFLRLPYRSVHHSRLVARTDLLDILVLGEAAIDQLKTWAERVDVPLISQDTGADPAAVVHDAIGAAKARDVDVLICDTAGRLHNKKNLMNELEKMNRIMRTQWPDAHHYVYLVIDATTGQNALIQVKLFSEKCNVSGLIVTKLDGTAKGGAIVAARKMTELPVIYIGVGEAIDDLLPFDADDFAAAII